MFDGIGDFSACRRLSMKISPCSSRNGSKDVRLLDFSMHLCFMRFPRSSWNFYPYICFKINVEALCSSWVLNHAGLLSIVISSRCVRNCVCTLLVVGAARMNYGN